MKPIYLVLALLILPLVASAGTLNTTNSSQSIGDTLNEVTEGTQNFVDQVKLYVPYEIWMALAIVFFFTTFMARTSINHQTHIWKLGLYLGLALFIGLFLLTL
jgi:hypothetical protein